MNTINWTYCRKCGWQTDEPNTAAAQCCKWGYNYTMSFTKEEYDLYLPRIKEIGLKTFAYEMNL